MISGYQIQAVVSHSFSSVVYQAIRTKDQQPVILKLLQREYPTPQELIRYRREYEIIRSLDSDEVIKAYHLKNYQHTLLLVLEDFGGESLKKYISQHPLTLAQFFPIALQITRGLSAIHAKGIIHKDINPSNIIFNQKTGVVKIIDFNIATQLKQEKVTCENCDNLEGSLAYISPEQTGRMNRSLDYRSDFYSLGVTLYELLTGQLPFLSTDILELVYAHLAKQPPHPHQINSNIATIVSEIVMKLMAKNAEDRYQSSLGLIYDLEQCQQLLNSTGDILPFELAKRDACDRFLIPEKLYGRESEVQTLLNAFERISGHFSSGVSQKAEKHGHGKSEILLVAGFSGIGKTALINQVHKPIIRQRGYFIKGKFDQFNHNIPLSAFVEAFRSLIGQLLRKSDEELALWKRKILEVVGEKGQILINVIPELEKIIGQQPQLPKLDGSAAQNQFNLLFIQFVQVFAKKEHPLVIFLDDLQWADLASLNLLKLLMSHIKIGYLLVLGAYRDHEVFPAHPLRVTLLDIEKQCDQAPSHIYTGAGSADAREWAPREQGRKINTLILKPLTQSDITHLVADTLRCSTKIATPVSELIYQKTQGNPFFTTQFLKGLYEENCIQFNREIGHWQCDLAQVRQLALTSDVVEFTVRRLQKLPVGSQEILKRAACMGNLFDLGILAVISERQPHEIVRNLWTVLQEGLIVPNSEIYELFQNPVNQEEKKNFEYLPVSYRFLHDRIQQAAYCLIPESDKKKTHYQIGQLLLQKIAPENREERIFEIVNHLNLARELISDLDQQEELACLNRIAAKKAKLSTAYHIAAQYLSIAISLLKDNHWKNQYDLSLNLYLDLAEVEYINTHFEAANKLIKIITKTSKNRLDCIKAYEIEIQVKTAENKLESAIETGLKILEILNIKLLKVSSIEFNFEAFYNFPEVKDPKILAALRALIKIAAPAYNAKPSLIPSIAFTMVDICIRNGNSFLAAYAYAFYGMILCSVLDNSALGYQMGRLALQLLDRFPDQSIEGEVHHLFNVGIRHWKEPASSTLEAWKQTIQLNQDSGNIGYVCYAVMGYCINLFLTGISLEYIEKESQKYIDIIQKEKQDFPFYGTVVWLQCVQILRGESPQTIELTGELFDEVQQIPFLKASNNLQTLFSIYLIKGILCYLFEKASEAVKHFNSAQEYQQTMAGLLAITQYPFYHSLALLAGYPQKKYQARKKIMITVEKNQMILKKWAKEAPMNYQHKYDLVEAEKHRVLGKKIEAMELYDRAILGAKENQYIPEVALANERAAKFYLEWKKEKVAKVYMSDAYYAYRTWGARAKVKQLEEKYSYLLIPNISSPHPASTLQTHPSVTSTSQSRDTLDLASLMRASQAIIDEIVLEKMLKKLIQTLLENVGAQSGFLILETKGKLLIEAAGSVDQEVQVLQSMPLEYMDENGETPLLSSAIINYVYRTKDSIVLPDAAREGDFIQEHYIQTYQVKSVVCAPLLNQGKLNGIIYLENNLVTGAFTTERLEILQLLSGQAAIAIAHARLYSSLEQKVIERTEELSRSQAKFFGIVNIAEDAIISIDDHQNIQLFNQGAEKIFGYSEDEILGQSLEILLPVSNDQHHQQHINRFGQDLTIARRIQERTTADILGRRKNGEEFPAEASISKLKLRDSWLYTVMLKDMTQRKQAEEKLRQSEANLSAAQRVAHVGSWDFNLLTQEITWSEETFRIYGLDPNQKAPSYEALLMMIHPDDRASWEQQVHQSLVEKISYTHEFRLIRPSGEIRYVESRGEVVLNENHQAICVFGVSLDITERKQIEIVLEEREKQYRDLVQTANCIIIRWDVEGNIIFLNQYGSEFFCWPETEIIGKSVIGTIVPEWDSSGLDLQSLMKQICQQPDSFLINENENIRQNGERVWINWANKPTFNDAGELVEILSIGTDITDRKRSEEALAQKNIDLEAAKKIAEKANQVKSQFLANMSHELRTPLNAILGFAQVMQRNLKHDPDSFQQESAQHLQIIHTSGNYLLSLINDVLDMSKIEAGKVISNPYPFDLHQLLRSLEGMFQLKASDKGLTISVELARDVPQYIETDEAKLRQILINLLGNAIKCTETGGVTLKIWGTQNIYFEVKDTGCGIAPDQLQKLFDAFYQAEADQKAQEGTGLGLTITKSYIDMFGGEIHVQSTLGKGSIFQFYIPVTVVDHLSNRQEESQLSVVGLAPNQPSYRILVTEDKWESRTLLVKLLTSVGFEEVREAKNGLEAVEIFESWQPHLIWMDMRMPVMDGYEATQRIRNHLKGQAPAIIALTASALEQEKQIVLSAGCDDFVYKPFEQQVIFEKLYQHLGVEYIYDDQSIADDPQTQHDLPQLTASRLSQTPRAWLVQLHEAASLADAEWVSQLIEELPASDADITQALADWVKSFRCDLIEELAESSIRLN